MKNRKNGFTLIEMIVCIGIIAALGVVIGLNANKVLNNSNISNYEDLMTQIFDAASVYSQLSDSGVDCSVSCNITLKKLVERGLLDKNIYDKSNPVYEDMRKFKETDVIIIQKNNGVKEMIYRCKPSNTTYDIKSTNIEDYNYWEKC